MSADPPPLHVVPNERPVPPYRPTLFDRLGPDAGLVIRAFAYGGLVFGMSIPLFASLAPKVVSPAWPLAAAAFVLVGSAALGACAAGTAFVISNGAGRTFGRFTMGGDTTPYREQYSREQALVMRGEVDEALRAFEAVIASDTQAVDPRMRAAELYVKERGNHRRAAELFREVQRIPTATAGEDVYASNRLVDLYTGPLANPGRALVELRRLIEHHPNTPAAAHARAAINALKPRLHRDA